MSNKTFLCNTAPVSEYVRKGQPNRIEGIDERAAILPFDVMSAFGVIDATVLMQTMYAEYADKDQTAVGVHMNANIMRKNLRNVFDYKTVLASYKRLRADGVIVDVLGDDGEKTERIAVLVGAIPAAMRARRMKRMEKIGARGNAGDTEEGEAIESEASAETGNTQNWVHPKTETPKTGNSSTQKRNIAAPKSGTSQHPKLGTKTDLHLLSENNKNQINTKSAEGSAAQTSQPQQPISQIKSNQTQSQSPEMAVDVARIAQDEQTPSAPMQPMPESESAPMAAPTSNFVIAGHKIYGLEIPTAHKAMLNDIYRRAKTTLGDAIKSHTVEMWEAIIIGERNRVANPVVTQNTQNRPSRGVGVFADANPHAAKAYGRGTKSSESAPVLDASPPPASWDELMNEVVEGQKLIDHLTTKYPAYDGIGGRPALRSILDGCKEYYAREKGKTPLPFQVENWVSKDYQKHVVTYEESRGMLTPALADNHGNKIKLIGNRRWTHDDRARWSSSHWWIQETQSWSDSDPKDALVQISQEEIDAARAAVFSGIKNIGKPPAQKTTPAPKPETSTIDDNSAKIQTANKILVEHSLEYHRLYGDPQGPFDVIDVRGMRGFFPAGYAVSEVDRQMALAGCRWHPLMGWCERKQKTATPLVSETGEPIGNL